MVKDSDSKGKSSGLQFSIKPWKLYVNSNIILINKNSEKTGLTFGLTFSLNQKLDKA